MSPARALTGYRPGRWTAVVGEDICVLIGCDPAADVARACWHAVQAGRGLDGVLAALGTATAFAAVGREAAGVRVVVHGAARAEIEVPGAAPEVLDSGGPPTSGQRQVDPAALVRLVSTDPPGAGPLLPIVGGVISASHVEVGDPAAAAVPDVAEASTEELHAERELAAATTGQTEHAVPPSASPGPPVVLDKPPPAPAPAAPIAAPPDTSSAPLPDASPTVAPSASRVAAPIVPTVFCPNQHPNPPWGQACRLCGAPIAQQEIFGVPRPPLGVLLLADGRSVPLDRDVVFGRAPFGLNSDSAYLVQVPSPGADISRSHVRIGLDGWLVLVTDLGSTNGTLVRLPGEAPVRLRAHDPFAIVPGTVVALADEVDVRYETSS